MIGFKVINYYSQEFGKVEQHMPSDLEFINNFWKYSLYLQKDGRTLLSVIYIKYSKKIQQDVEMCSAYIYINSIFLFFLKEKCI